jgi:citronellol/citronellal dehydrogenase
MNKIKNEYAFVLKSIKKNKQISSCLKPLKDKSYIVSGGTRGIGYNIAKNLALCGANVTIIGKTKEKHPKLDGTIYSAAEKICSISKRPSCMGLPCDIRNTKHIKNVIDETMDVYGKIDGVVLNASALCLNNTLDQTEKEVELMSSVNINGTYLFGQECLKRMNKKSGHMLIIAPPIEMLYTDEWWVNHFYYSMSKFNMTLMAKYWNKEFPNIAVNTLWPRTTINTAPVKNLLGGSKMMNISRRSDIMGTAAKHIFASDTKRCNGYNFIDDEVLASLDIDVEQYRVNKDIKEKDLMPDFFC